MFSPFVCVATVMCVGFCSVVRAMITTTTTTDSNYDLNDNNSSIMSLKTANNFTYVDLNASDTQLLNTWISMSNADYADRHNRNNRNNHNNDSNHNKPNALHSADNARDSNSSVVYKRLVEALTNKNRREDDSLGLPPDIAFEYIDNVNPPKFRISVPIGGPAPHSTESPFKQIRVQAGSSVVTTKINFTGASKPSQMSRNVDLAVLLKAELDAKKAELDQKRAQTPAPNLFALLPGAIRTANPFLESNYKEPNRVKASTTGPHIAMTSEPNNRNNGHLLFSDGTTSNIDVTPFPILSDSFRPMIPRITTTSTSTTTTTTTTSTTAATTTTKKPFHTTTLYSVLQPKIIAIKSNVRTTLKPVRENKYKIKLIEAKSTPIPIILISKPTARSAKQNTTDWSLRVNDKPDIGSGDSNDLKSSTTVREDKGNHSHEPIISDSTLNVINEYESDSNASIRNEYADIDYADNNAINSNVSAPGVYAEYPGASYRLTTERLAYILIGSCCALSVLCLIVVAMSVRCRDMCDEYRSWKKAEKAALRWQRHQYRLAHHQQDLSRYFRTSVEANRGSGRASNPIGAAVSSGPAPIFGPSCCHCLNCSSSWLFRDVKQSGWYCQRGYYHPPPRGKLPFGAASTVNTFMPPRNVNNANNYCDEGDETDSLNASDLIDNHHHTGQQCHFGDRTASPSINSRPRHHQLRRIAQPNGNPNWIHSSEIVDELHKKHCNNMNHMSNDQQNIKPRHRQFGENVVVWNNNDERLI